MGTKTEMLDGLLEAIEERRQQRGYKVVASGTPTTNYMHGPGGIFGVSGLEKDVFSTRVAPMGLAGVLQAKGSMRTNPLYPYLTGFQADGGSDPAGPCDNCQVAGPVKSCIQTAQFGRYCRMSKEIELNRVGQQTDRGEFFDLRLVNDPIVPALAGQLGLNINAAGSLDLAREVLVAWLAIGVSLQNVLATQLYVGNPANNNPGGGYREFPGLDILIGTNKVDALTGTECPSLDSDIKDFNYGLVCNTTPDIVEVVSYMLRYLRHNASRMGFDPVEWVITMRPDLFYELTACWPCSYLTYRCNTNANSNAVPEIDAADAVKFRDEMRNGNYLLIDGMRIPVVLDDGIHEENPADNANIQPGQYASDIYFIPMSVKGGLLTTYWEYMDYTQGLMLAVDDGRLGHHYWTDAGRFAWTFGLQNWCAVWEAKIEPRVILLTPQLAGRIQNVRYQPLQHTRDPFPADPYFVDGGRTYRTGPSYYSDWNMQR